MCILIIAAALPASATRIAKGGLYPNCAFDLGPPKIELRASARSWARSQPDTRTLTLAVRKFLSASLFVKQTSGTRIKSESNKSRIPREDGMLPDYGGKNSVLEAILAGLATLSCRRLRALADGRQKANPSPPSPAQRYSSLSNLKQANRTIPATANLLF